MALRHIQPGRYKGFTSTTWNGFVDAANAHSEFTTAAGEDVSPSQDMITVRNDSGADVERHRCLTLATAPILTPGDEDLPTYRAHEPFWRAIPPVLPDHWDRWAVPIAPIAKGLAGLAVYRGMTPAMVTFRQRYHPRVEPDPDNVGKLRSCVGGIARIMHNELTDDETYPVDKLCLIDIEGWPTITVEGYLIDPLDSVLLGTVTPTVTATRARMAVYRNIWTDPATATSGGNTASAVDVINTTSSSYTVSVQAEGHGLSLSSANGEHTITITGAEVVGGINVTGTHDITAVTTANHVEFRAERQADATESSSGGDIVWYINTPGAERLRVAQIEIVNESRSTGDPGTYCRAIWLGRSWQLDAIDTGELRTDEYEPEDYVDIDARTDGT
jgi:hypothetical protein